MKKTRKGFTLVELLVVIAIVAILATVAIIGYTSFTKKAEMSNDRTLVAQLNTAVTKVDGKYESMHEVAEILAANGFDIAKIKATSKDHEILWDMEAQAFFYTADEEKSGANIWIVSDSVSETYSTYYIGGESIVSNTATSICVVTNGTNLTVNAPNADVYHAGDVADLTIVAVANASYHEFGRVTGLATVKAGHVVVENGGSIGTLVVENAGVTLSGSFGVVVGTADVLAGLEVEAEQVVTAGSLENVDSAVALVGNTFYDDFADALAVGGEIVLVRDVTYAANKIFTVEAGQTVTIDLNGHVIAAIAGDEGASTVITNKGTLTIKDSVGGGKITTSALNPDTQEIPSYASNTINNHGTLTLEGGLIENTTSGPACYPVDCYVGSTFVMNGGKLSAVACGLRLFANGEVNVTINGGEIDGGRRGIWVQLPNADSTKAPVVNLTINGGNFVGSNLTFYSYSYGNSFANTNVTITGGTFQTGVAFGGGYKGDVENVSITGGTFNDFLGRYLANDGWEDIAKP